MRKPVGASPNSLHLVQMKVNAPTRTKVSRFSMVKSRPIIQADGVTFRYLCRCRSHLKESGICSSVSLVSGRASAQTARPATSIATLRCETVTGQAGHRLTDALRSIGLRSKAPALIKGKRCARLCRSKSVTDLHPVVPPAPKGENHPGAVVPARASCPVSRFP